jgi:hypothetical protein
MQKKLAGLLSIVLVLLYGAPVALRAQNLQPQSSLESTIGAATPAVNLTFNNSANPYLEYTTGANFIAPPFSYGAAVAGGNPTNSLASASGYVFLAGPAATSSCTVGVITIQFYTAPAAGTLPIVVATGSGTSYAVTEPATVSYASTTALQTFTVGAGLSNTFSIATGNLIGFWGSSSQPLPGRGPGATGYTFAAAAALPSGTNTYSSTSSGPSISASCQTATGTILSGQTGFDNTKANELAVSIPYNGYLYAPSNALGDFEWNQPMWGTYQIDRLNWGRSGTKILVSKGNIAGGSTAKWWEVYLTMDASSLAQFCIKLNGANGSNSVTPSMCTAVAIDNPNGYNYNLFWSWDGVGSPSSLQLYVNGTAATTYFESGTFGFGGVTVALGGSGTGYQTTTPFENVAGSGGANCVVAGNVTSSGGVPASVAAMSYTTNYGCSTTPTLSFAPYVAALSGSGTGYATSTAFTSTGGGTGCSITGTMASSGGVPASVTVTSAAALQSCTSAPTLVLTAPTGTGAVLTAVTRPGSGATLTATLPGASISTASTAPLYLDGAWSASGGSLWSVGAPMVGSSSNTSEPNVVVDQFAMGVGTAATPSLVQGVFYQTKFYQGLLKGIPSTPYTLIFSDDGCTDADNLAALALAIASENIGYVRLAGVEVTTGDGDSNALYRQMVDQGGLAHIPTSVPSATIGSNTFCTSANLNTYNSATPQTTSAYESSLTMYRTVFAANPTTPVFIMMGGSFQGMSDFMQSPADSISSLTGAQLLAQNATNGGAIYAQGLGPNGTYTTDNTLAEWVAGQYVLAHNGSHPIVWYGGAPQSTGPGIYETRNSKDPYYLALQSYGTELRPAYDSLPEASFLSSAFADGVTIAITGSGTGYANSTAFTSTGGGPNCVVTGTMVSTGGVPASITYPNSSYPTYFGAGGGCTTAPTIVLTAPTGTGVVLTATPLFVCGTATVNSATSVTTSTSTCSNHYFANPTNATATSEPPILQWFLNSLIDPPPNGAPRAQ